MSCREIENIRKSSKSQESSSKCILANDLRFFKMSPSLGSYPIRCSIFTELTYFWMNGIKLFQHIVEQ